MGVAVVTHASDDSRITGHRLFVNDALVKMFGHASVEDMAQADISQSWVDVEQLLEFERMMKNQQELVDFEARRRRIDGIEWWVSLNTRPVRFDGLDCTMVWHFDVTDRKRAEDDLRRLHDELEAEVASRTRELTAEKEKAEAAQELFAKAYQSSPALFTISSPRSGKHMEVNDAWSSLTGYSREDALRNTVGELGLWADTDDRQEFIKQIRNQKFVRNFETTYRTKSGGRKKMLLSGELIEYRDEECLLVVGQDVTEQKKLETELLEATKMAEAANLAKSEFLATMSHEIRTPMAGVLGMADILLEDDLTAEQRNTVLKIKGAGQALVTILNDILDLSKIQAGKLEIENIDFDLRGLLTDTLDLLYPKASGKGIALASKIDPNLPAGINGDPTRIRQVLVNLLGNAVKFTERGSVTLCANVAEYRDDAVVLRFEIIDTGIGIAHDRYAGLFEDFTQLDASTARKYEGTGLGLAISRRLSELLGGEIGVDSVEGEGSTFWFTVAGKVTEFEFTETAGRDGAGSIRTMRPLHILVAEDNDLNQEIIKAVLAKFDHTVIAVDDGRAAVDAVRDFDFDIVLMDVRMPEMDGTDATRVIRQQQGPKSAIPILAVTADAMVENRKDYFDAGMNACVTKPINQKELLRAINDVLDEEIHVGV